MESPASDSDTTLVVRRTFPAPPQRVFQAWTTVEDMKRWSAPFGMEVRICEVDLKVGGQYRLGMASPGEDPSIAFGEYREISPPNRLVYTWQWEGGEMKETLVTVEFLPQADGTEVVLTHELFPNSELRDKHQMGWGACLDSMERMLATV